MAGLTVPREPLVKIDQCLEALLHRSRAICVFLADVSGQLICEKGNRGTLDTVSLAALAAGNLAATAEMAKRIGENAPFSYLFHEGERRNAYISAVGDSFILVIVFDEMTQIGLVRIFARLAVGELRDIAPELEPWMEKASAAVDREFGDALAEGLDQALA
jgi:predicted regulator of Ras-like GTPase activity (Roadblock/LC7/MglB family)